MQPKEEDTTDDITGIIIVINNCYCCGPAIIRPSQLVAPVLEKLTYCTIHKDALNNAHAPVLSILIM